MRALILSKPDALRALLTNMSGLAAILVFLRQVWAFEPLEQTLLASVGTGLAVYMVLLLTFASLHVLAAEAPEEAPAEHAPQPAADEEAPAAG